MKEIKSIFIANRGEIAVRILKTAREMGFRVVTAFTPDDAESLHVKLADKAVCFEHNTLQQTFLSAQKLVETALAEGCNAVHPGYGFLSEDYRFAELCRDKGLVFIGPSTNSIRMLGDKSSARKIAGSAGIPVLAGIEGEVDILACKTGTLKFPVLVKAVAGGGGKGLYRIDRAEDLAYYVYRASREATSYFGDERIYLEPFLENARHIEVQLLGDRHGNLIHLFERECSVQRLHQKVIEEAPAVSISHKCKKKIYDAALRLGKLVNYDNVGTVEFLVDEQENYYFLEMNTRIQVEHGVTEMITGIDLVRQQILAATERPLEYKQEDVRFSGHVMEARIYAENPLHDFRRTPGKVLYIKFPEANYLRVDTNLVDLTLLPEVYDSLLAKVLVIGNNRKETVSILKEVLKQSDILGVQHNLCYLETIIGLEDFYKNKIDTNFLDTRHKFLKNIISQNYNNALRNGLLGYLSIHFLVRNKQPVNVWELIGYGSLINKAVIFGETGQYILEWKVESEKVQVFVEGQKVIIENIVLADNDITLIANGKKQHISFELIDSATYICVDRFNFRFRSDAVLDEARIDREVLNGKEKLNPVILSPLFGKVVKINYREKKKVEVGETILILESMKMENFIKCPDAATVKKIWVEEGDQVRENQLLVELEFQNENFMKEVLY